MSFLLHLLPIWLIHGARRHSVKRYRLDQGTKDNFHCNVWHGGWIMNLYFTVYGAQFHLKPKSVISGFCASKCAQQTSEEEHCRVVSCQKEQRKNNNQLVKRCYIECLRIHKKRQKLSRSRWKWYIWKYPKAMCLWVRMQHATEGAVKLRLEWRLDAYTQGLELLLLLINPVFDYYGLSESNQKNNGTTIRCFYSSLPLALSPALSCCLSVPFFSTDRATFSLKTDIISKHWVAWREKLES